MSSDAPPKPKRCPRGTRKNKQGICVPNAPAPVIPQIEPQPLVQVLADASAITANVITGTLSEAYTSLSRRQASSTKGTGLRPPPLGSNVQPEPVPLPIPSVVKPKRCPRGTRKNKQGVCVPNAPVKVPSSVSHIPTEVPAEVPAEVPVEVPVEVPTEVPTEVPSSVPHIPTEVPASAPIFPSVPFVPSVPIDRPLSPKELGTVEPSMAPSVQEPPQELSIEPPQTDVENTVFDTLYPLLGDASFSHKLAHKQEFIETRYDGTIRDIKATAEKLCNVGFELLPHQLFVRNFLSLQTPYNSLLMYHGLGSGKTCSAIGICEEMRQYMKQMGIRQRIKGGTSVPRIIIVASLNVQENFRLQLFDPSKLKFENGRWNLTSCVGESLLSEINPTQLPATDTVRDRERIITSMRNLINTYYVMMGYVQFRNFVAKAAAEGTAQGTAQGTVQGIVPGGQYTAFKGGSGSGWNGGPSPFFPANAAYPSYPLNNHMSDPNNPSMVTNAGQPHMIRGGRNRNRSMRNRNRSNSMRSRSMRSRSNRNRSSRRGHRGGSWIPDVLFGNNGNNVVYQSNTTPGAELQRAIFMQKGIDSSPFSQMGPSSHNRLYV